jgi:hypothetical protein
MDVNEWMSYECLDDGIHTRNIQNSSTRSHLSEEEFALEITTKCINGPLLGLSHAQLRPMPDHGAVKVEGLVFAEEGIPEDTRPGISLATEKA